MKQFVNKEVTYTVPFMGGNVKVRKLPPIKVEEIQAFAQERNKKRKGEETDSDVYELMQEVFRHAVVGAEEITIDELKTMALTELTDLFKEVLKSIGMTSADGKDPASGN